MVEKPAQPSTQTNAAPNAVLENSVPLSHEQRLNWLRLIRSSNVGPATFRDLVSHFRTAQAALEALPELIGKGGQVGKIRIASREAAEQELEFASKNGARFIGMGEPEYPKILRTIDYPPPLLCVKGNLDILAKKSVAIVGSRNASISGLKLASRFSSKLGKEGYSIISGLARGIDASAHKSALKSGTIAVFAGGVDHIFPLENQKLAHDILDNEGALISEMPMGHNPRSKDFPRRNRLIAGIAHATLVVEAAKRSGSLISARLANEAGRTVFAIPGSPLDPRSAGSNWLIKQGATLVTEPEDIIELQSPGPFSFPTQNFTEDEAVYETQPLTQTENTDEFRTEVINALGPTPVELDDIVRFSGASIGQVQLIIIELSLAGKIERHAGNRVSLVE